jgi:ribosomal protein S18 acetylase RimI-like enzyme
MTGADVRRAAEVITDAFADDPFWTWLFPPDKRRLIVRSWVRQLRVVYVPKGHSYVSDGLEGAALWAPPSGWQTGMLAQLRLAPLYVRLLGPQRLRDATRGFAAIERGHPDEPHWYLSVLAVSPAAQRSGIGRSLVEPMLERADREHVATSLETFKAENVPYYERYGFRVWHDERIVGGPHMWAMVREPRRSM